MARIAGNIGGKINIRQKLEILADAAKYDASCSSSGSQRRSSVGGKGVGSTEGSGICHAYAPDGRCISLLKVLLTNYCKYDCLYCVNRISSNVQRARFTVDEVVQLTLDFYKRNYIEGLFLSSGIMRNPDYTMEHVVEVARRLHQNPTVSEIEHCKWWLGREIELVKPKVIVALGGSAFRALTSKSQSVKSLRGAVHPLDNGASMVVTNHPSYILRLSGDLAKSEARLLLKEDLRRAFALAA